MSVSRIESEAHRQVQRRRRVAREFFGRWPTAALVILILLMMAPYFVALIIAGKSQAQFDYNPYGIVLPFYYHQTFATAWRVVRQFMLNSFLVSALSCVGVLGIGSAAAYVFARFDFPGREPLFILILALLMIPGILMLVPRFVIVHSLGVFGTRWSLILPYVAGGQLMAIFLLRTFFAGISAEFFESARMDGASEFRCYWNIALPLSRSILGVVAVLQVLGTWNDLMWPYINVGAVQKLWTIPVGLLILTRTQVNAQIGVLMAGYVLGSLPLVLLFSVASRQYIEGITAGGIKL